MSLYVYNLGFEPQDSSGCTIPPTEAVRVTLSVQASPSALRVLPFTLVIQNASNVIVKKFKYNRMSTDEFVLKAGAIYDWRTPAFNLPAGSYKVTAGYSAYSDIPAGKYYACGDTGVCEPFIEVAV